MQPSKGMQTLGPRSLLAARWDKFRGNDRLYSELLAPDSSYSFDARGFTATDTTLWNRLPMRTKTAASMAMPMMTG